jgi:hypothetical protein
MVAHQVIGINLQLWFNARFLQVSFWKFLGHQLYIIALLAGIAWLVSVGADEIIQNTLLAFLVSGVIYTLGVAIVFFLFPSLVFMSRASLIRQLTQLRTQIEWQFK